eukprot:1159338-Pelagomonas_calceolata.AAC.4
MHAHARTHVRTRTPADGASDITMPPMGYMWLWLGSFKRWQRRFFVASEAPGLLLIYKRSSLKGKVGGSESSCTHYPSGRPQKRLACSAYLQAVQPEGQGGRGGLRSAWSALLIYKQSSLKGKTERPEVHVVKHVRDVALKARLVAESAYYAFQ